MCNRGDIFRTDKFITREITTRRRNQNEKKPKTQRQDKRRERKNEAKRNNNEKKNKIYQKIRRIYDNFAPKIKSYPIHGEFTKFVCWFGQKQTNATACGGQPI